eukprot:728819-Amphidinium_carterae.1
MPSAIEKWETNYHSYRERTREELSDAMQRMCLMGMCPPHLVEHLEMQIARLTTYDLRKAEIVRYAEAIRSRAREEGPVPMDISSLQVKGK